MAAQTIDRRAKIAACELLHSIAVYIIGRNAQMVNVNKNKGPITALYKKLFPILLSLACDVDKVGAFFAVH